jgi:hypothetical protein
MSSIASYVLAGYRRDTLKSSESSLKYFLLGSFATAFSCMESPSSTAHLAPPFSPAWAKSTTRKCRS